MAQTPGSLQRTEVPACVLTSQDTGSATQHRLGLLVHPNDWRAEVRGPCLTSSPVASSLKGNAFGPAMFS